MSVWSGLGMNYGNDIGGFGAYNESQVTADLTYLRNYISVLRLCLIDIAAPQTGFDNFHAIADIAKGLGFYVSFGVGRVGITSANWGAYKTAVASKATDVQAWGTVDEFQIGNELELWHDGSITDATIQADLATLATTIKNSGVTMKISYSASGDANLSQWEAIGIAGLGGLDYIAFNCYAFDNVGFMGEVQSAFYTFGKRMYLTEWSANHNFSEEPNNSNEGHWSFDIYQRYNFLRTLGISKACIYTYRSTDNWNLVNTDGTKHTALLGILGLLGARGPSIYGGNPPIRDFGSCLKFNGTNQWIDCASVTPTLSTSAISYGGWFRIGYNQPEANAWPIIIGDSTDANGTGFYINKSGNFIKYYFNSIGGASQDKPIIRYISYGQWVHLVVTYDGVNIRAYCNGILVQTDATTGAIGYADNSFHIAAPWQWDNLFKGSVDEAFVYNSALTANQILQIYNGTFPTTPVVLYKFDEGTGTSTITDSSGNGNTGTLNNSPTWSLDVVDHLRTVSGTRTTAGTRTAV